MRFTNAPVAVNEQVIIDADNLEFGRKLGQRFDVGVPRVSGSARLEPVSERSGGVDVKVPLAPNRTKDEVHAVLVLMERTPADCGTRPSGQSGVTSFPARMLL